MLSQSFGDPVAANEADNVTALEFDGSGNYLATGDRGGRVVIFREAENSVNKNPKGRSWMPYFQFQSHEAEFDYLKSLEVEEKINQIQFCRSASDKLLLLSTNDKTVKLWKIFDRHQHTSCAEASFRASGRLELPKRESGPRSSQKKSSGSISTVSCLKRAYKNAHAYHIHSISVNYDGESFISADDLRINNWNLEREDICLNLYDMKPPNMEELTEVITCARAHPTSSALLSFGTSRGTVKLLDTRVAITGERAARVLGASPNHFPSDSLGSALDGHRDSVDNDLSGALSTAATLADDPGLGEAVGMGLGSKEPLPPSPNARHGSPPALRSPNPHPPAPTTPGAKSSALSLFSEIVSSVSDINFAPNGNYLLSRDFLSVRLWDLRMERQPALKTDVHDHVRRRMSSFADPDCMFDKFQVLVSPDSARFITGSYSNQFGIWNVGGNEKALSLHVPGGSDPNPKPSEMGAASRRKGGKASPAAGEIRTDQKILHCAWHPHEPTVAVAGQAGVYLYTV